MPPRYNKNIPKATSFFSDLTNAILTALSLPPLYPDQAVPISGYFVGPNYSANRLLKSGEKLTPEDVAHPSYDEFDEIAKYHDIAYNLALSFPDPEPFLKKADEIFVQKTQQLEINKTALVFDAITLVLSAYGLYQTAQIFKQAQASTLSAIQQIRNDQLAEDAIYQARLQAAEIPIRARYDPHINNYQLMQTSRNWNRGQRDIALNTSHSRIAEIFQRNNVQNPHYQPLPSHARIPRNRGALVPAIPDNIFNIAPDAAFDIFHPAQGEVIPRFALENFNLAEPIILALSQSLAVTEILSTIFAGVGAATGIATLFDLLERFTIWASEKIFTNIVGNHELRPTFTKLDLTKSDIELYLDSLYNSNNPLDLEFIELYKSAFAKPDLITQPTKPPEPPEPIKPELVIESSKDFTPTELLAIYQIYF